MKVIASLAALALATPAMAQTPPPQTPAPASDSVTHDLNSGPPAPATYLAPAPAPTASQPTTATTTRPTTAPAAAPAASGPAAPATTLPRSPASTETNAAPARAVAAPATTTPRSTTAPATSAPHPTTAPAATAVPTATAPAAAAVAAPPPPSYTVLDAPARAALPFAVNLPAGFVLDAERSGPDFKMYAVRRNGTPFVMIYAGPSSEFPIYGGERVTAAGRTSIVATEDGQRHAMEHLFDRQTAPHQIHIWVASLDGADRAMAEAIAQSVDVR